MLHGFPECWYSWRHQIRALSDRFECVAPEMRGYGESDAPVGVGNYTLDKLVGDVADLIEALGHKRATVVGHDWGGAVAWATAMMRPDVVDRLIVMNCPHLERMSRALRRNPRQMLRSWYMLFFQIRRLPEWVFRRRQLRSADKRAAQRHNSKECLHRWRPRIFPRRVPQSLLDHRRDQLLSRELPHRFHGPPRHQLVDRSQNLGADAFDLGRAGFRTRQGTDLRDGAAIHRPLRDQSTSRTPAIGCSRKSLTW